MKKFMNNIVQLTISNRLLVISNNEKTLFYNISHPRHFYKYKSLVLNPSSGVLVIKHKIKITILCKILLDKITYIFIILYVLNPAIRHWDIYFIIAWPRGKLQLRWRKAPLGHELRGVHTTQLLQHDIAHFDIHEKITTQHYTS